MLTVSVDPSVTVPPFVELRWVVLMNFAASVLRPTKFRSQPLFTDVEGSTTLLKKLGDAYAGVLAEHRRILRSEFARRGGAEVEEERDWARRQGVQGGMIERGVEKI